MLVTMTKLRQILGASKDEFQDMLDGGLSQFQVKAKFKLKESCDWWLDNEVRKETQEAGLDLNYDTEVKREAAAMARKQKIQTERITNTLMQRHAVEEALYECEDMFDKIITQLIDTIAPAVIGKTKEEMITIAGKLSREILTGWSELGRNNEHSNKEIRNVNVQTITKSSTGKA